jgi:hypothetical protein
MSHYLEIWLPCTSDNRLVRRELARVFDCEDLARRYIVEQYVVVYGANWDAWWVPWISWHGISDMDSFEARKWNFVPSGRMGAGWRQCVFCIYIYDGLIPLAVIATTN